MWAAVALYAHQQYRVFLALSQPLVFAARNVLRVYNVKWVWGAEINESKKYKLTAFFFCFQRVFVFLLKQGGRMELSQRNQKRWLDSVSDRLSDCKLWIGKRVSKVWLKMIFSKFLWKLKIYCENRLCKSIVWIDCFHSNFCFGLLFVCWRSIVFTVFIFIYFTGYSNSAWK